MFLAIFAFKISLGRTVITVAEPYIAMALSVVKLLVKFSLLRFFLFIVVVVVVVVL